MSGALDFTLNRQVDAMTNEQREAVLNSLIHQAAFQTSVDGDDTMEQRIRKAIEQETQK